MEDKTGRIEQTATAQLSDVLGVEVFPDIVTQKTACREAKKLALKKWLRKQEKIKEVRKAYHPVWKADYVLNTKSKSVAGRLYIDAVTGELMARKNNRNITSRNLFAFMKLNGPKRRIIYQVAKYKELSASDLAKKLNMPDDTFQANVAGLVEKAYVTLAKSGKNPKIRLRVHFILPESILEDSLLEIQKVNLTQMCVPMERVIEPKVSPEYVNEVLSTFRDIQPSSVDLVFRPVWCVYLNSKSGERTIVIDAF